MSFEFIVISLILLCGLSLLAWMCFGLILEFGTTLIHGPANEKATMRLLQVKPESSNPFEDTPPLPSRADEYQSFLESLEKRIEDAACCGKDGPTADMAIKENGFTIGQKVQLDWGKYTVVNVFMCPLARKAHAVLCSPAKNYFVWECSDLAERMNKASNA